MKKLNLMRTIVNITTILLVVLLVAQIALLFMPYFEGRVLKKTYQRPDPQPTDFSMMDYAFFQTEDLEYVFKAETKSILNGQKYSANLFVMEIVWAFTLGAIALVFNITSKRGFFTQIVSILWAVVAIPGFLTGAVFTFANTVQWVHTACIIVSILGGVVVLVRLFPWFADRFLQKKFMEEEAAAEA